MTKDAFEMLTDELTLIRHDMANLQRTSLNKDEAKALSQEVAKGVKQMANAAPAVYEAISSRLDLAIDKIRREAVTAAREATSGAIEKSHAKSINAARDLSKAAGGPQRGLALLRRVLGVAGLGRRCRGRFGASGGHLDDRPRRCKPVWSASGHLLQLSRRPNRHQSRRP